MGKGPKPNSTRKPPEPSDSHADIDAWAKRVMPDLQPIVKELDASIRKAIPKLQFAVKWKKAYCHRSSLAQPRHDPRPRDASIVVAARSSALPSISWGTRCRPCASC